MNNAVIHGLILCALGLAANAAADEYRSNLGRVFLTPSERAALDKKRLAHYENLNAEPQAVLPDVVEPTALEEPTEAPAAAGPPLLVNGYVRRHGTTGTVWINGESSYDGDLAASNVDHLRTSIVGQHIRISPLESASESAFDKQQSVYLKPGQVYEPEANSVSDAFSISDAPAIATD